MAVLPNGKFIVGLTDEFGEMEELSVRRANFEVNVAGGPAVELGENGFWLKKITEQSGGLLLEYFYRQEELWVEVELSHISGTNVIVQSNRIKNAGKETKKITRFSSASVDHIFYGEDRKWYANPEIRIHICHSKWQGEGQWRAYKPAELGLYPGSVHGAERASYKIQSVGSWSTGNFYPMTVAEDGKKGCVWYLEMEGANNWYIKLCAYGGYAKPDFSMEASGCDESNGGWHYDLKPGETYGAQRAFWGVAAGGFEEATKNLNDFKRADCLVRCPPYGMPLVFNDYMDCVWLDQRPETLFPLIDRAAQVGCEVFCIDGGWCENKYGEGLGDWLPAKSLYTEYTLEEVAGNIRAKGMIPGIWTELETCTPTAAGAGICEEAVLRRYDNRIGGEKWFYNFCREEVREYLLERVDALYRMGFRYIKNDYNHSLGIGCTNNYGGDSPAEGMIRNHDAFLDFMEELYRRYPDLMLENCGSGGLRSENKTLRRFMLQSISDQELYKNNPSILMGSIAVLPPEKAGIWVYPYPTVFADYKDFLPDRRYLESMADGKQTAFNLICGLMGTMYLSGRIDLCDSYNLSLIKQGVSLYKKNRKEIMRSRPVYPTGIYNMNEKELCTFGLLTDTKLFLAVWNLCGEGTEGQWMDSSSRQDDRQLTPGSQARLFGGRVVGLQRWVKEGSRAVCCFPEREDIKYRFGNGKLVIEALEEGAAFFLEILL